MRGCRYQVSGIILCGGSSSRMGYENKCLLKLGDKTFIEIAISKLKKFFPEVILVTREEETYIHFGEKIVKDIFPEQSSLTGIHAGLMASSSNYNFIIGCDTPLIKAEIIDLLISQIHPDYDIIVPKIGKYFEPLCAIYSKKCIPYIEKLLSEKIFKISKLFSMMRVKQIGKKLLTHVDPFLISFFNVNCREDYQQLLKIYLNLI